MKYETILDATRAWVREFNEIPHGVVEKLMECDPDNFYEITPPAVGDSVYVWRENKSGEITEVSKDENGELIYSIALDAPYVDEDEVHITADEFGVQRYERLPMWGTMWAFGDSCDNWWIENAENLQKMADCGFRIYEQEDYGYIFGIDGAGYDFYEAHWIPLYKARGLHWHKEPYENKNSKSEPGYLVRKMIDGE